ncbi:hypothetical protein JW752_02775 [Candidatus Peregrinibacteria bacterium]|nr:hypothetical protein [Candidatus Peregrinibacteria bacterium]
MELSLFIAKIAAVIYLASGAALINNNLNLQEAYKSLKESQLHSTYLGIFVLVLGTLIVSYHNLWVKDWTVLITIIGWVLLAEGICYILCPKALLSLFKKLPQSQLGWGIVTLLVGLFFGYFGFVA